MKQRLQKGTIEKQISSTVNNNGTNEVVSPGITVFPKLTVGAQNDRYEQEAETVSRQVAMSTSERQKPHFIQAKREAGGINVASPISNQIADTAGKGSKMDNQTKSFMEHRFGAGFSHVNIHNGEYAAGLNRSLSAHAFTVGNDIYFNSGQYQPQTQQGKTLLAHELTHTLQQQQSTSIQKDGEETPSGVDFDFELLPPHLQLTLPHLLLDANSDRVRTQFTWNDLQTSLQYSYGSSIDLGLRYRTFSTQVGFNPSSSVLSYGATLRFPTGSLSGTGSYSLPDSAATLGLSGSYRGVRLGGSYNFGTGGLGVNLGYGAPLMPTPDEMGSTFGAAGSAVPPLVGSVPGIMPDPMAWYAAQQQRIEAVTKGVEMFNRLREEPASGIRFGVAGRLSYSPATGLFVFVGAGGSF